VRIFFEEEKPDQVVNFAAESHVDRSIEDPQLFLSVNILGTQNLLDATPRTGSIPLHLGEGGADSGKTQPEKSLNRRILALAGPAFGALIAERAKAAGISAVVFDRGGNKYTGRVAAVAEAAREGGLEL